MESASTLELLVSDLFDVSLPAARTWVAALPKCQSPQQRADAALAHPAARHALGLSRAWRQIVGRPIAKPEACLYLRDAPPSAPALDRQRFQAFAHADCRLPKAATRDVNASASLREYERALENPSHLRTQALARLLERHLGLATEGPLAEAEPHARRLVAWMRKLLPMPLLIAYREIVGASGGLEPSEYFREHHQLCAPLKTANPLTGHTLEPAPFPCDLAVCKRDAWRSALVRDLLLTSAAPNSTCLLIEAATTDLCRPCVVDALIDETAQLCQTQSPLWLAAPDTQFLCEPRDFYHLTLTLGDSDAYDCIPRLFDRFLLVGATPLPTREPLSRPGAQTVYYAATGGAASQIMDELDLQLAPPLAAHLYTLVADSIASCNRIQRLTNHLAYFLPQFSSAKVAPTPTPTPAARVPVGHHPDSMRRRGPAVPPDEAGACDVYVHVADPADPNHDGVLECLTGGGTPVVGPGDLPEPLKDGRNCIVVRHTDTDTDPEALATALTHRDAGLLHREDTARFLWRELVETPCPIRADRPASGALLLRRFEAILLSQRPEPYQSSRASPNTLLAIDNRRKPGTALAVAATLRMLEPGWNVVMLCAPENEAHARRALDFVGGDGAEVRPLFSGMHTRNFHIEQFNALMKSMQLWEQVPGTRCLTVQDDGILLRPGLERHACFLGDFPLVGAPWLPHPYLNAVTANNLVGNGGLSLRSVAHMRAIASRNAAQAAQVYPMAPTMTVAEDVFFSAAAQHIKPCPRDIANQFSAEQTLPPDARPLGVHAFWRYHPVAQTVALLETALREALAS